MISGHLWSRNSALYTVYDIPYITVSLEINDDLGIVFGAVAGSIILILLLIVLLPWLRNYLCPGLTFGYCIHKTKEVNVERAFDEELLLDDEKITVLKEIAR